VAFFYALATAGHFSLLGTSVEQHGLSSDFSVFFCPGSVMSAGRIEMIASYIYTTPSHGDPFLLRGGKQKNGNFSLFF
jgi:hypothetical protein